MRRPENPQAAHRTPRLRPQVSYDAVVAAYVHAISSRHGGIDVSPTAAED